MRLGFALALILSWPMATQVAVTQDWAVITQSTSGRMLALDKDSNAYVAGAVPLATIPLTKYGPTGAQLWQRVFDNPMTRGESNWDTLDPAGNLIVVGLMLSTNTAAGTLLWSPIADKRRSPDEYPNALAVGPDNAVYVTGEAGWLSAAFGNVTTSLGATTEKYHPDGTFVWSTLAQIPMRGAGIKLGTDGGAVVVRDGPQALLHYTQDGTGYSLPTAVAAASRTLWPEPLTVNFSSVDASVDYRWNSVSGSASGNLTVNKD